MRGFRGAVVRDETSVPPTLDQLMQMFLRQALTERDFKVLEAIFFAGGVMMTHQIADIIFGDLKEGRSRASKTCRRLRVLYNLHLLNRANVYLPLKRHKVLFKELSIVQYLTPLSSKVLVARLEEVKGHWDITRLINTAETLLSHARLAHDLLAVELWALLAQVMRQKQGAMTWRGPRFAYRRREEGKKTRAFAPDALACFTLHNKELFCFVEVDMGTERMPYIRKNKLRGAESYYISRTWQKEFAKFPPIIFVTQDERRAERIAQLIKSERRIQDISWFISSMDQIRRQGADAKVWSVPGRQEKFFLLD